jgi:hypothetical protein
MKHLSLSFTIVHTDEPQYLKLGTYCHFLEQLNWSLLNSPPLIRPLPLKAIPLIRPDLRCIEKVTVLKMKIWIYWSELNSWINFYIVLNKNWKIYWSEQSFTGLGPEDWCSLWWLSNYMLVNGPLDPLITRTLLHCRMYGLVIA